MIPPSSNPWSSQGLSHRLPAPPCNPGGSRPNRFGKNCPLPCNRWTAWCKCECFWSLVGSCPPRSDAKIPAETHASAPLRDSSTRPSIRSQHSPQQGYLCKAPRVLCRLVRIRSRSLLSHFSHVVWVACCDDTVGSRQRRGDRRRPVYKPRHRRVRVQRVSRAR